MKNRSRLETLNPGIGMYVFPNPADTKQYEAWGRRYSRLAQRSIAAKSEQASVLTPDERREMKELFHKMEQYKLSQRGQALSIMSGSQTETPLDRGKDNKVYTGNAVLGRNVIKYSSNDHLASPETVEYLQKKYQILRRFMGPWIPRSYFVLGERRKQFYPRQTIHVQPDNRLTVITIQKEVNGKTFQKMSAEEKSDPVVVADLQIAHRRYIRLKKLIRSTCIRLGLPEDTLDVKLDIGHLSKQETIDEFDVGKIKLFTSPNIMYDTEKEKIRFVDFDMNTWNKEKEMVFLEMMKLDPRLLD